jgi:hypothetical protein
MASPLVLKLTKIQILLSSYVAIVWVFVALNLCECSWGLGAPAAGSAASRPPEPPKAFKVVSLVDSPAMLGWMVLVRAAETRKRDDTRKNLPQLRRAIYETSRITRLHRPVRELCGGGG